MYGKYFASTFTGSMLGAGSTVFAVWGYVIAHAVEETVELNPKLLSTIIGCSVEEVTAAISYLLSPDPDSRNKAEDGRRLVKEGVYQYRVVSHRIYKAVRDEAERRDYNRLKKQEERQKKRAVKPHVNDLSMTVNDLFDGQQMSAMSANTEAEAETKAEASFKSLVDVSIDGPLSDGKDALSSEVNEEVDTPYSPPPDATPQLVTPKGSELVHQSPPRKTNSDPRHTPFRGALAEYWRAKNGDDLPWDARDAKGLKQFLDANPRMELDRFRELLKNRALSQVAHGERVYCWITNITKFSEPLDRYNRPAGDQDDRTYAQRNQRATLDAAQRVVEFFEGGGRVDQVG